MQQVSTVIEILIFKTHTASLDWCTCNRGKLIYSIAALLPHAQESLYCLREQVLFGSIPGAAIPATPITAQWHPADFRFSLASLRSHLLSNHLDILSEELPQHRKDNSRESTTMFKL